MDPNYYKSKIGTPQQQFGTPQRQVFATPQRQEFRTPQGHESPQAQASRMPQTQLFQTPRAEAPRQRTQPQVHERQAERMRSRADWFLSPGPSRDTPTNIEQPPGPGKAFLELYERKEEIKQLNIQIEALESAVKDQHSQIVECQEELANLVKSEGQCEEDLTNLIYKIADDPRLEGRDIRDHIAKVIECRTIRCELNRRQWDILSMQQRLLKSQERSMIDDEELAEDVSDLVDDVEYIAMKVQMFTLLGDIIGRDIQSLEPQSGLVRSSIYKWMDEMRRLIEAAERSVKILEDTVRNLELPEGTEVQRFDAVPDQPSTSTFRVKIPRQDRFTPSYPRPQHRPATRYDSQDPRISLIMKRGAHQPIAEKETKAASGRRAFTKMIQDPSVRRVVRRFDRIPEGFNLDDYSPVEDPSPPQYQLTRQLSTRIGEAERPDEAEIYRDRADHIVRGEGGILAGGIDEPSEDELTESEIIQERHRQYLSDLGMPDDVSVLDENIEFDEFDDSPTSPRASLQASPPVSIASADFDDSPTSPHISSPERLRASSPVRDYIHESDAHHISDLQDTPPRSLTPPQYLPSPPSLPSTGGMTSPRWESTYTPYVPRTRYGYTDPTARVRNIPPRRGQVRGARRGPPQRWPTNIHTVVRRGEPPAQTPTTDRRHGMFTPKGIFKKKHWNVRKLPFDQRPLSPRTPPVDPFEEEPYYLGDSTISWEHLDIDESMHSPRSPTPAFAWLPRMRQTHYSSASESCPSSLYGEDSVFASEQPERSPGPHPVIGFGHSFSDSSAQSTPSDIVRGRSVHFGSTERSPSPVIGGRQATFDRSQQYTPSGGRRNVYSESIENDPAASDVINRRLDFDSSDLFSGYSEGPSFGSGLDEDQFYN